MKKFTKSTIFSVLLVAICVCLFCASSVLAEAGTRAPDQSTPLDEEVSIEAAVKTWNQVIRVSVENWFFSYGSFLLTTMAVPLYTSFTLGELSDPDVLKAYAWKLLTFLPLPFYLSSVNALLSRSSFLPKFENGSFLQSRLMGGFVDVAVFSAFDCFVFDWQISYLPVVLFSWILIDFLPTPAKLVLGLLTALISLLEHGIQVAGFGSKLEPIHKIFEDLGNSIYGKFAADSYIVTYLFDPIYANWASFITEFPNPNPTPVDYLHYIYRGIYPFVFPAQVFISMKSDPRADDLVKASLKKGLGLAGISQEIYFHDEDEDAAQSHNVFEDDEQPFIHNFPEEETTPSSSERKPRQRDHSEPKQQPATSVPADKAPSRPQKTTPPVSSNPRTPTTNTNQTQREPQRPRADGRQPSKDSNYTDDDVTEEESNTVTMNSFLVVLLSLVMLTC